MIEALIFDFDGIIIESEEPDFQAWREIYQSFGLELTLDDYSLCIGAGWADLFFNPYTDLSARVGHAINWDEIESLRKKRVVELVENQPVLPGVKNYLEDAKRLKMKIGLASSSPHVWVDNHLIRLGLMDYFQTVKCSDDVEKTKPAPTLYQVALADLGVEPHKAIALEDSQNGVTAAKKAGMYCVVVPTNVTSHMILDDADLCLNSLTDMSLERLIQYIEK